MKIELPEYCVVLLMGARGSGKTHLAQRLFSPSDVLSLDQFRAMVGDQSHSEEADADALEALSYVMEKRLRNSCLTVVDAINLRQSDRKAFRILAKRYHAKIIAIVLDLPEQVIRARLAGLSEDQLPSPADTRQQFADLKTSLNRLQSEGIRTSYTLKSQEEAEQLEISFQRMPSNFRHESGPFDVIGDVHGCLDELKLLLDQLGYVVETGGGEGGIYYQVTPPAGRKAVFVGDLVDRGPDSPGVLKLVMSMVRKGAALWVPGNHDDKLCRKLQGRNVQLKHGLAETVEQMEAEPQQFHDEVRDFIKALPHHVVLDHGNLVVSHAGIKEHMQGRESGGIKSFCLYGETTGETDEFGLPIRYNWAENYRGRAIVVYGHTPIPKAEWLNRTINIDTGCVFGGALTALRYPEKQLLSVPAAREYSPPSRPLPANVPLVNTQEKHDEVLDFTLFRDRSLAITRMLFNITPKEYQIVGAIEYMNRYAVHPKWLIYLPPVLSPPKAAAIADLLEHPAQAFSYYQKKGVESVMMQEMHWGTRTVVIVTRDEQVVSKRFGLVNEGIGVIYTENGRPFFKDETEEQAQLGKLRTAIDQAGWWDELKTDWLCLEVDMVPAGRYNAGLLNGHFAHVGHAGINAWEKAAEVLEKAAARGLDVDREMAEKEARLAQLERYQDALQHPLSGSHAIVPIHVLACEGRTFFDHPHSWHMEMAEQLSQVASDLVRAPRYRIFDPDNEEEVRAATAMWEQLTANGGKGMVAKPNSFLPDPSKDVYQPGLHIRGREALRLIYGPHYDDPQEIGQHRKRGLKLRRELSLRELALAHEAIHRFVENAPLSEVHQCVFIHLSIRANMVDPRL